MRSYRTNWSNDPREWPLEDALWASWMHDMEKCYALLTRVCISEVVEDYDHEQTQQAAY